MLYNTLFALAMVLGSGPPGDGHKLDKSELPARFEVKELHDLVYRPLADGEDAAKNKNKLDLYLPEGVRDFPVMLFIHGGAWVFGDKNQFGLYHNLAAYWARRGVGVVVANYRLSPGVKHPSHVQDVAKAFVWTRNNIARFGGDVGQLFISGQSAGGHLVSLLATDESYLRAEGARISDIHGVLGLSGVYTLPSRMRAGTLPLVTGVPESLQAKRTPFSSVFGSDPKVLRAAVPINHVHNGLPPFLIVYAEHDPKILRDMAADFVGALERAKQSAELIEAPERNHITELVFFGRKNDPVAAAMTGFLRQHAKLP